MNTHGVIDVGGKQYIVKKGDTITVEKQHAKEGETVTFPLHLLFSEEGEAIELGAPHLEKTASGEVLEHFKGDKIRIAKFKSKVRSRVVRGFRAELTKIKIMSL
ncbi:MAG: 50S ribosomal protein L21 [bacterium]|nr:50S ribosomal protein L21 [bacterium]